MEFIIITALDLKEIVKQSCKEVISETPLLGKTSPMPEENPRYLLKEAAAYCRMPVPSFRTHLAKRNVSGSKPGKIWIFTQKDLDDFLQRFHRKSRDELEETIDRTLSPKKKGHVR